MSGLLILAASCLSVVAVVWQLLDDHHSRLNRFIRLLRLAVSILYKGVMGLHALVLLRADISLRHPLLPVIRLKNRIVVHSLVIALTLHNCYRLVVWPLDIAPIGLTLRSVVLLVA